MSLRFCANLNFLFCENGVSALEKFRLAKAAGFRGVEMACPDQFSKDEVAAAQKENGLDVVLLNISLGDDTWLAVDKRKNWSFFSIPVFALELIAWLIAGIMRHLNII